MAKKLYTQADMDYWRDKTHEYRKREFGWKSFGIAVIIMVGVFVLAGLAEYFGNKPEFNITRQECHNETIFEPIYEIKNYSEIVYSEVRVGEVKHLCMDTSFRCQDANDWEELGFKYTWLSADISWDCSTIDKNDGVEVRTIKQCRKELPLDELKRIGYTFDEGGQISSPPNANQTINIVSLWEYKLKVQRVTERTKKVCEDKEVEELVYDTSRNCVKFCVDVAKKNETEKCINQNACEQWVKFSMKKSELTQERLKEQLNNGYCTCVWNCENPSKDCPECHDYRCGDYKVVLK